MDFALVIGVVVNYITCAVGNVALLFGGVTFIVAAIILNSGAYRRMMSSAEISNKGVGSVYIVSGAMMGLFINM